MIVEAKAKESPCPTQGAEGGSEGGVHRGSWEGEAGDSL